MFTRGGLDDDEAAEKAAVRLGRQAILDGPDPAHATAILYESVLHRLVGTPAIMAAQLSRLLEMSRRRNVVIQVVRDTGYFPGLRGAFKIASGDGMPDTLLMEAVEDQTSHDRALTRTALAQVQLQRQRRRQLRRGRPRSRRGPHPRHEGLRPQPGPAGDRRRLAALHRRPPHRAGPRRRVRKARRGLSEHGTVREQEL